jgi:hypothetical protein
LMATHEAAQGLRRQSADHFGNTGRSASVFATLPNTSQISPNAVVPARQSVGRGLFSTGLKMRRVRIISFQKACAQRTGHLASIWQYWNSSPWLCLLSYGWIASCDELPALWFP